MARSFQQRYMQLVSNPFVILAAIGGGAVLGSLAPSWGARLQPFGAAFVAYLNMCAIPIMIAALILSFGRIVADRNAPTYLTVFLLVFVIGLTFTSSLGVLSASLLQPGSLSGEAQAVLSQALVAGEAAAAPARSAGGLGSQLLDMLIPANIFAALTEGRSLQILFFSLILGLTVGLIPKTESEPFLQMVDTLFQAFQRAINVGLLVLPFGLFSIFSAQIAQTGVEILLATAKLIGVMYGTMAFIVIAATLILWAITGTSPAAAVRGLRAPFLFAFGTANGIATIPLLITALKDNFGLERDTANFMVPLNIIVGRYSVALIFASCAMFLAQLYGLTLTFGQLLFIAAAASVITPASAGMHALAIIALIDVILTPLGLPYGTALLVMLAVMPLIDPMATATNAHLTGVASLIVGRAVSRRSAVQRTPSQSPDSVEVEMT